MRRDVYIIGGIVLGVITIAMVGRDWFLRTMIEESFNMRPERVAEAYFETPVREMRDIKGVGIHWQGYEHKVRFRSDVPVRIKEPEKYVSFKPDEHNIQAYKLDFPEDASQFNDGKSLECLRLREPEPTRGSSGRYLVNNTKSHTYFFRSWNAH